MSNSCRLPPTWRVRCCAHRRTPDRSHDHAREHRRRTGARSAPCDGGRHAVVGGDALEHQGDGAGEHAGACAHPDAGRLRAGGHGDAGGGSGRRVDRLRRQHLAAARAACGPRLHRFGLDAGRHSRLPCRRAAGGHRAAGRQLFQGAPGGGGDLDHRAVHRARRLRQHRHHAGAQAVELRARIPLHAGRQTDRRGRHDRGRAAAARLSCAHHRCRFRLFRRLHPGLSHAPVPAALVHGVLRCDVELQQVAADRRHRSVRDPQDRRAGRGTARLDQPVRRLLGRCGHRPAGHGRSRTPDQTARCCRRCLRCTKTWSGCGWRR